MLSVGLNQKEAIKIRQTIDSLYAQCHKRATIESVRKKKIQLIQSPSDVLNAAGQPMYKFIGGPAHGQYTTRKNDTAFFELEGGGYAYYFFLESENNYHYKFWLQGQ